MMFDVAAIHEGLSASPKRLNNHTLMYDEHGSQLFAKVCEDSRYYTYQHDLRVIVNNADKIAKLVGQGAVLVDIGCAMCHKSIPLLESLDHASAFVGIDIDASILELAKEKLKERFPTLEIVTVVADFTKRMEIPVKGRKIGFIGGNSIAVYPEKEASEIIRNCLDSLGENGVFLASFDSNQDPGTNSDQYTKTAFPALVCNALPVMNHEFQANFDPNAFSYTCRWNPSEKQVEHLLVAQSPQNVTLQDRVYTFEKDEPLQLFFGKKWSVQDFSEVVRLGGGVVKHTFSEDEDFICLVWVEKAE